MDVGTLDRGLTQGKKIESAGVTRGTLTVRGADGREIQIKELFALGRVKQPLVCAGKFLRQGWSIVHGDAGLCLKHEERGSHPVSGQPNGQFCS